MRRNSSDSRVASAGRSHRSTLAIAIAAQGALLLLTLFVIVAKDAPREPPAFEGEHLVTSSDSARKTSENIRQLQRRMSRPRTFKRLAVESSFAGDLPPAPVLPDEAFDPANSGNSFFEDSQSLLAGSALMSLAGGMSESDSAAEFFGVQDTGRRIVIMVNTSASVVRRAASRGVSVEEIQAETVGLVEGLSSGTLFGIVQFSQGTRSFSEQLVPALAKNKRVAGEWVRDSLKGNPPIENERYVGHEAGFREAMVLQPDLIFVVTDGSLNRRVRNSGGGYSYPKISFAQLTESIAREMRENGVTPRIHIIGFELGDAERAGLSNVAKQFDGSLREF